MQIVQKIKGFLGRTLIVREWLDDKELTEERKKVCHGCKFYAPDADTCKICHCLINVKTESSVSINVFSIPPHYEETHCPVGKWPKRQEDGNIGGNDLDVANFWRKHNGKKEIV